MTRQVFPCPHLSTDSCRWRLSQDSKSLTDRERQGLNVLLSAYSLITQNFFVDKSILFFPWILILKTQCESNWGSVSWAITQFSLSIIKMQRRNIAKGTMDQIIVFSAQTQSIFYTPSLYLLIWDVICHFTVPIGWIKDYKRSQTLAKDSKYFKSLKLATSLNA